MTCEEDFFEPRRREGREGRREEEVFTIDLGLLYNPLLFLIPNPD